MQHCIKRSLTWPADGLNRAILGSISDMMKILGDIGNYTRSRMCIFVLAFPILDTGH